MLLISNIDSFNAYFNILFTHFTTYTDIMSNQQILMEWKNYKDFF